MTKTPRKHKDKKAKQPSTTAKVGRPSKYQPEFATQAHKLALLGATDVQLADFFEVSESTLNEWKLSHPEFSESLKAAKDEADNRVQRSLYERACGYSHPDVHISSFRGEVTITPIVKHYPPDTVAGIFWLKNRKAAEWRERVEFEHGGSIRTSSMTDEELLAMAREVAKEEE